MRGKAECQGTMLSVVTPSTCAAWPRETHTAEVRSRRPKTVRWVAMHRIARPRMPREWGHAG